MWGEFGIPKDDKVFLERFRIKNYRGQFYIQIAMDWGRSGGPLPTDYINVTQTAWPKLLNKENVYGLWNCWVFDEELLAQKVLANFKKAIKQYWIRVYQKAEEMAKDFKTRNRIIETLDAMQYAIDHE